MADIPDPRPRLLQHYLILAQQALGTDNLPEAQEFFDKALRVEGNHPDRELDIRQALTRYGERVIAHEPSNWDLADQALATLGSLDLENEETRAWQRQVKLKHAQSLLEDEKLEDSFQILADLMASAERLGVQEELKAEIARLVCDYVSQRAEQKEWALLDRLFKRVSQMWSDDAGLHDWLETISKILAAAVRAQTEHQRRLEQILQSHKRFRALFYTMVFIFAVTVVAYTLVMIS